MKLISILCAFFSSSVLIAQDHQRCIEAFTLEYQQNGQLTFDHFGYDLYVNDLGSYVILDSLHTKQKSYWFKINLKKDEQIEFSLKALDSNDIYNFCMYEADTNSNFCERLLDSKVNPIRTNLFQNLSKQGIGLKHSTSTKTANNWSYVYDTPYQEPVSAKALKTYYINAYRVKGTGCGFDLQLGVGGRFIGIIMAGPKCYSHELHLLKSNRLAKPSSQKLSILNQTNFFKNTLHLDLRLLDSISRQPIEGTLSYEFNGETVIHQIAETQLNHAIILEGKFAYELLFNAVGYQSRIVNIEKNTLSASTQRLDVKLAPVKSGNYFNLDHIYFYAGTFSFTEDSKPTLNTLYTLMQQRPNLKIEIRGHTNGKGKVNTKKQHLEGIEIPAFKGDEKKLSKYRALAVQNYLVEKGIQKDRITIKGMGDTQMRFPKPNNQYERDANKRVEVVVR